MTRAMALRFNAAGQFAVEPVEVAPSERDDVLVAPRFVGICATDLELLDGTHPYLQSGLARYPLQPGHEWSGVVVESGSAELPAGTRVVGDPEVGCGRAECEFCPRGRVPWCPDRREIGCRGGLDGAAATLMYLPASCLRRIPDEVDDEAAVLAEPALTVLGGLHRVGDVRERSVLVLGAGTIGTIAIELCASLGAEVRVREPSPERARAISDFVLLDDPIDDRRYEVVIVATGALTALGDALAHVANGGDVLLLGVPGEPVPSVDVSAILHRDATVHGVLNYSTAGPTSSALAMDAIASGVIDARQIVDSVYPLSEAEAAFDRARLSNKPKPKVLLSLTDTR